MANASRVHHCIAQELIAQGLMDPPAKKKCTCKKFVSYKDADRMVKNGEASWAVVKRDRGTVEVTCSLCKGDPEVKNCAKCKGSGKTTEPKAWDTYNNDIVLVSEASVDPKETKYRPALAMKTPRVATIESEHIERAYVEGNHDAAARIEEYGNLIQWSLQELGAQIKDVATGEEIFPGRPEPKNERRVYPPGTVTFKDGSTNKSWWWEIEGRDYDRGRAI